MVGTLPSYLTQHGRRYNRSGGRTQAGSVYYINPASGEVLQVHRAVVTQTGPLYFLAMPLAGGSLVRVDNHNFHGPLPSAGHEVLIGPAVMMSGGPRSPAAWRAKPAGAVRQRGIISQVAFGGGSGLILAEGGGSVFVGRSSLAVDVPFVHGQRVSFRRVETPRGPAAHDVWRA